MRQKKQKTNHITSSAKKYLLRIPVTSVSSTTINFLPVTKPLNTHRERETLGFLNIEFGIREQE
jgi:hypothetical protein